MTDQFDNEDEIILSELADDELILQMHDDIYDGLAEEIAEGTRILLERGWSAPKVLEKALVGGMAAVGVDFRDGILFVPEVLMSANAMKAGMTLLKPILSASGTEPIGKVVVGMSRLFRTVRVQAVAYHGAARSPNGRPMAPVHFDRQTGTKT